MADDLIRVGAPTAAELVERARALVPFLRERAEATEQNRSLLPEVVAAFEDAGFYRILQPAAFGGYEMHPMALFHVAKELARGCPSSAWCLSLVAVHNWELGLLDPRVAKDVWGQDDTVRISSSYAPFGTVERVEGGFRISGRWPWSSGCDHCQWAMLGGVIRSPDEPPDARAFLIPHSEYQIDDTWHVLGLKGTGSKDVVVAGAFVPDYRTHRFNDSFMGQDPGLATFSAPTYRYPFGIVFAFSLSVVTLGMAEGARESFLEQFAVRRETFGSAKSNEDPFVRQRVAEADAIVRGLRLRLEAAFTALDAYVERGEPAPLDLRVQCKWDAQHVAKEAARAVELLFKASGARGIRLSNPLQRFFRDIHAASNHAYLNADKGGLNAGGVLMGATTSDFSL